MLIKYYCLYSITGGREKERKKHQEVGIVIIVFHKNFRKIRQIMASKCRLLLVVGMLKSFSLLKGIERGVTGKRVVVQLNSDRLYY